MNDKVPETGSKPMVGMGHLIRYALSIDQVVTGRASIYSAKTAAARCAAAARGADGRPADRSSAEQGEHIGVKNSLGGRAKRPECFSQTIDPEHDGINGAPVRYHLLDGPPAFGYEPAGKLGIPPAGK